MCFSSAVLQVCAVLILLPGQHAVVGAAATVSGGASKPVELFEAGAVSTYITDGEPTGYPLPGVYAAAGVATAGGTSGLRTVSGSRKLLQGCGSSDGCATTVPAEQFKAVITRP